MRLFFRVALLTFLVDQITKVLVVHLMDLQTRGVIDVVSPFLNFRMAWNRGINFGLFAGDAEVMRWGLIVLALGISGWVTWWVRSDGAPFWQAIFGGLLVGGALGNVLDRLVYGAVADFLNMSCCGLENPYVFNVADIAIFAGALGLVLVPAKSGGKTGRKKKTP